jgi:hypothetical protein
MSRHDLTFRAWITRVDRYLGAHLATVTRWRIFRLWPLHLFVVVAAWDPKLLEAERAAELARWAKAEAGPSDDELLTAIRAVVSEWSATVEAQDSPWPDYQDPLAARDSFVRIVDLLDAEALS